MRYASASRWVMKSKSGATMRATGFDGAVLTGQKAEWGGRAERPHWTGSRPSRPIRFVPTNRLKLTVKRVHDSYRRKADNTDFRREHPAMGNHRSLVLLRLITIETPNCEQVVYQDEHQESADE